MTSFKRDEEIVLDYNPNYWGKEPPHQEDHHPLLRGCHHDAPGPREG